MLERSRLLTYVFAKADAYARADGREAQNSNDFLASVYGVLGAYADGAFFDGPSTRELSAAFMALKGYGTAFDDMSEALRAYVRSEDDRATDECILFEGLVAAAEARAEKEGERVLSLPALLAFVMAEPTDAIRAVVLRQARAEENLL